MRPTTGTAHNRVHPATFGLVAIALAFGAATDASADRKRYRGEWTLQPPTRVNDFHVHVSVDESAYVLPAHNFRGFPWGERSVTTDRTSFTANWEGQEYNQYNRFVIGFDFETDSTFQVTRAWWTLDGTSVGNVPLDEITFRQVGSNEPFEDYAPGPLAGQGGWQAWNHDQSQGDFQVTDLGGHDSAQSIVVDQADNAVHTYDGFENGAWVYRSWQFVPGDFQSGSNQNDPLAGSWFVVMSEYEDGGPFAVGAACQVDSNDGMLKVYAGDPNEPLAVPYIVDQWVPIDVVVDLETDFTQVFYAGNLIAEYPWTVGAMGDGAGVPQIAAVNLWARGSSPVFYDDLMIEELPAPRVDVAALEVLTGSAIEGGVEEVTHSDDAYFRTISGFGSTLLDAHNMTLRVRGVTNFANPGDLTVAIESRLDEPSGTADIRLMNWQTGELDRVDRSTIGDEDSLVVVEGLDPARYLNPQGEFEMQVKHTVFAPFFAFTFESFFDQVEVLVR